MPYHGLAIGWDYRIVVSAIYRPYCRLELANHEIIPPGRHSFSLVKLVGSLGPTDTKFYGCQKGGSKFSVWSKTWVKNRLYSWKYPKRECQNHIICSCAHFEKGSVCVLKFYNFPRTLKSWGQNSRAYQLISPPRIKHDITEWMNVLLFIHYILFITKRIHKIDIFYTLHTDVQ